MALVMSLPLMAGLPSTLSMPSGIAPTDLLQTEPVSIGLLIPDSNQTAAVESVRLAIDEANEKGGFDGTLLRLVIRSTEGPWGSGSKESVNLVYQDGVSVIIGALDGRNGHLAEQVATKSHLTYLETVATESTLSQAFVPYFMRCVPNDDQQARAILDKVERNGGGSLAVLSNSEYDNLNAARSFSRIAHLEKKGAPVILDIDGSATQLDQLLNELKHNDVRYLVFPFRTRFTLNLLQKIRQELPDIEVYGTLAFIADLAPKDRVWSELEGMVILSTGIFRNPEWAAFRNKFEERTGHSPTISSAYTYDGASMLIEAIRRAGADREAIKDILSAMTGFDGVTGAITFDEMGNRKGPLQFIRVTKGDPVFFHASSTE
jgi:branched-chain amino acid transport system substrate-binding protein